VTGRTFRQITGLDKDFTALTMFQRRPGNHSAVKADASQLPFTSSSFHAVVAIQCSRCSDPARFLAECRRVLDPSGWLILQIVNRRSYKATLKRMRRPFGTRRMDVFPARTVLDLFARHGFDVCDMAGYNWLPFAPRITRMSNSSLIPHAARLERGLGLTRLWALSPWVLVAARRRTAPPGADRNGGGPQRYGHADDCEATATRPIVACRTAATPMCGQAGHTSRAVGPIASVRRLLGPRRVTARAAPPPAAGRWGVAWAVALAAPGH
jgi:hypothetical protein